VGSESHILFRLLCLKFKEHASATNQSSSHMSSSLGSVRIGSTRWL
jgi:hypothetical protein